MKRFVKRLPILAAAGALGICTGWALLPQTKVEACLHPPREFKYPIKAGAQKGLVLFANGREKLVIRPSYKIEGEGLKVKNDAVEGFTTLAWIVPVPNLPDTYKEADAKLFSELEKFTKPHDMVAERSNSHGRRPRKADKALGGTEFLEQVKVGDYTIQPVKAKGELGAKELNGWLKDNGFGDVDAKVMKYYLDHDYYWLAVKLHRDEGLPKNGEVKPLLIGFKTDKPVYPMKINQGRGAFDLELWLITNYQVDLEETKSQGLKTVEQQDRHMGQSNRKTDFKHLPKMVKDMADGDVGLKNLTQGDLYCYRLFGAGMDDKVDLGKLESDLTFPKKKAAGKEVELK